MDILKPEQIQAVNRLENGYILCGDVGSGKSRTGIAYYYKVCGGSAVPFKKATKLMPLYIITTARKRDKEEWVVELALFDISPEDVVIDSWNNISKYVTVTDAFFLFDEQRVVGSGTWAKSFLKITKNNKWILLSATPGDCWKDYETIFVANGFYKNATDFRTQHIKYARYTSFPKIEGYYDVWRLQRLSKKILVDIPIERPIKLNHVDCYVDYDIYHYKETLRNRWNYDKNEPIVNASELCQSLRKIVNSHPSRVSKVMDILLEKKKAIVFYNFDYELDILKSVEWNRIVKGTFGIAEWNGHKHQDIPQTEYWLYLVQYNAGNEGWNCILTDTMIFYSENYSYKIMAQASGRINRLNTPFMNLYYYHLKSRSSIDLAIAKALAQKKKFNESNFVKM